MSGPTWVFVGLVFLYMALRAGLWLTRKLSRPPRVYPIHSDPHIVNAECICPNLDCGCNEINDEGQERCTCTRCSAPSHQHRYPRARRPVVRGKVWREDSL